MGKKDSPIYSVWSSMIQRCTNPKCRIYKYYGGRGIKVYDAWRSFDQFSRDMGERPTADHSLERLEVNGHYEPSNVVWLPKRLQGRNTRANRKIEYNGETLCLVEWAERIGLSRGTLWMRLEQGWPLDRALTPLADTVRDYTGARRRQTNHSITYKGTTQCLQAWADAMGLKAHTLLARLRKGWPVERALTQPLRGQQ